MTRTLEKRMARADAGLCLDCGLNPCCCAIPKRKFRFGRWRFSHSYSDLPIGIKRYKRRPKSHPGGLTPVEVYSSFKRNVESSNLSAPTKKFGK